MAEEIRRRVAALRLAALLAVAITMAGLTTRDAPRPVSARGVPADSVGTRQIVDGSIKGQDLKQGVALSPARAADLYLKMSAAADTYLSKIEAADEYLHKIEAASLYLKLEEAASYLKLEDAAQTYFKLDAAAALLDEAEASALFIKHDDAAATYLKLEDAAASYLKLEEAAGFLSKVEAADLYIKHDDAAATFLKLEDAAETYLKLGEAENFLHKVDAAQIYLDKATAASTYLDKATAADLYLHKDDAADLYLHKDEAAATYLKLDAQIDAHKLGGIPATGFVQGVGSVESGLALLGFDGSKPLLDLPGLVSATAVAQGKDNNVVQLVNTSGEQLLVSHDGSSQVLGPEGTTGILIGLNQPTLVQLVSLGKGGMSTLTLSATQLGLEQLVFTGQALVGTP